MERIELFHNLVNLAAADGKFTQEEVEFLVGRAHAWGIHNDEFETALAGIHEGHIEINVPVEHGQRVRLLKEMIRLMAVDGDLAEMEKSICAQASAKMDFTTDEFDRILQEVVDE